MDWLTDGMFNKPTEELTNKDYFKAGVATTVLVEELLICIGVGIVSFKAYFKKKKEIKEKKKIEEES